MFDSHRWNGNRGDQNRRIILADPGRDLFRLHEEPSGVILDVSLHSPDCYRSFQADRVYCSHRGEVRLFFPPVWRIKSSRRSIRRCGIKEKSHILEVGCGTGFMACRIVKEKNCRIVGIDISERMIGMSRELAVKQKIEDKAVFRVGDACALPFEDNSFDVVFSQFVTSLLDRKKALAEFMRVLKPGAFLGVVEIFKDTLIPYDVSRDIHEAERILSEAIELNLRLFTPVQWKSWFTNAGVQKIQTAEHKQVAVRETLKFIEIVGVAATFKIVFRYLYH